MCLQPKVLTDDAISVAFVVQRCMLNDSIDILDGLAVNIENSLSILLCFHILYSMTDEFCHIVVVAILTCRVSYVSHERDVSCNMSSDIDGSLQICVIMPEVLIFPIYSLSHSCLQEIREHEHDEVEYIFLLIVMTEVKEIEGKYLLKHVMKEKIITSFVEPGLNLYLKIANTYEPHHIACAYPHLLRVIGIQNAHDRRLPNPVIRRLNAIREDEQVLIFPAQLGYRLIGNGKQ